MINIFFVLLCVILAILFGKLINVDVPIKPTVLAWTGGSVERGNFTYLYVQNHGPIILNLTSLVGDADLYISDTDMSPTYDPAKYTLHSATCGEDIIEVPESLESPLAVGIYGHAESSFYILEIYENPNSAYPYKQWVSIDRDVDKYQQTSIKAADTVTEPIADSTAGRKESGRVLKKRKTRSSSSMPTIFSVLEMLQLIFL